MFQCAVNPVNCTCILLNLPYMIECFTLTQDAVGKWAQSQAMVTMLVFWCHQISREGLVYVHPTPIQWNWTSVELGSSFSTVRITTTWNMAPHEWGEWGVCLEASKQSSQCNATQFGTFMKLVFPWKIVYVCICVRAHVCMLGGGEVRTPWTNQLLTGRPPLQSPFQRLTRAAFVPGLPPEAARAAFTPFS